MSVKVSSFALILMLRNYRRLLTLATTR